MSIVTVVTAAESVALTTLDRAKAIIGISGEASDDFLRRGIVHLSQRIAAFCQRTLVQETVSEQFRPKRAHETLRLERYPVSAIASITADGTALAEAAYEYDPKAGIVWRLCNDQRTHWHNRKIVVEYTAGYVPPNDDDEEDEDTDPDSMVLEAQVIELLKRGYYALTRDPALKSKSVLNGILSYSLYDPSNADGALPNDICGSLEPYVKRDR